MYSLTHAILSLCLKMIARVVIETLQIKVLLSTVTVQDLLPEFIPFLIYLVLYFALTVHMHMHITNTASLLVVLSWPSFPSGAQRVHGRTHSRPCPPGWRVLAPHYLDSVCWKDQQMAMEDDVDLCMRGESDMSELCRKGKGGGRIGGEERRIQREREGEKGRKSRAHVPGGDKLDEFPGFITEAVLVGADINQGIH